MKGGAGSRPGGADRPSRGARAGAGGRTVQGVGRGTARLGGGAGGDVSSKSCDDGLAGVARDGDGLAAIDVAVLRVLVQDELTLREVSGPGTARQEAGGLGGVGAGDLEVLAVAVDHAHAQAQLGGQSVEVVGQLRLEDASGVGHVSEGLGALDLVAHGVGGVEHLPAVAVHRGLELDQERAQHVAVLRGDVGGAAAAGHDGERVAREELEGAATQRLGRGTTGAEVGERALRSLDRRDALDDLQVLGGVLEVGVLEALLLGSGEGLQRLDGQPDGERVRTQALTAGSL